MNKVGRSSFCKVCKGTAMVELAIILPLLLFLLFGITELGRALYQQNILTQSVELGGRYMARINGAVDPDSCNPVGITEGGRWFSAVAMAKNLIMCGEDEACGTPILPNITFDDDSFEVDARASGSVSACVITVRATAVFQSVFGENLVSVPGYQLGAVTLNAKTHERYIGY